MAQDSKEKPHVAIISKDNGSISSTTPGKMQVAETQESSKCLLTRDEMMAIAVEAQKKARETVEALSPEQRKAHALIRGCSPAEAMEFLEELEGGWSDGEEDGDPAESDEAQLKEQAAGSVEQHNPEKPLLKT